MTQGKGKPPASNVPHGRITRLGQFGRLAGGVAGGMMAEAARRLADGQRPRLRDMMLTPANVGRVADRLSHLRGAAMKLGQMISMDAGDFLPAELTDIMARLRDNAHHMPPAQLQRVLAREWGADWRLRFAHFDARPIAAASIGQVHRATTHDGRLLAIKVQYPGISDSIDADVDNVATLLRLSNLLPRELDIAPLLAEAKAQLRDEADYRREGEQMTRFATLVADVPGLRVPALDPALTTDRVLAMDYIDSVPIESLVTAPQARRDAAMATLFQLVLREMFEFGWMQTDPNFANYRYQPATGHIVLLDFGAVRPVSADTAQGYRRLIAAGLSGDRDGLRDAAIAVGFLGAAAASRHRAAIDRMIDLILAELHRGGPFDFGDRQFVAPLRDQGLAMAADRSTWHVPPADLLFTQRKISGMALLAARLQARVNLIAMLDKL
ncbi:MAG: AarF/ABC1/UbiB kinase family protein [bacterium]|nr:AarF/ABC1/UbiB kinase family protein [bacterium]